GSFTNPAFLNSCFFALLSREDSCSNSENVLLFEKYKKSIKENMYALLSGVFILNNEKLLRMVSTNQFEVMSVMNVLCCDIGSVELRGSATFMYACSILASICRLPHDFYPDEHMDELDNHFSVVKSLVHHKTDLVSFVVSTLLDINKISDVSSIQLLTAEQYLFSCLSVFSECNLCRFFSDEEQIDAISDLEQVLLNILFTDNEHDKFRRSKHLFDKVDEKGYKEAVIGKNDSVPFHTTFCLPSYRACALIILSKIVSFIEQDDETDEHLTRTLYELNKWLKIVCDQMKASGNNYFKNGDFNASVWFYSFCLRLMSNEMQAEKVVCQSNRAEAYIRMEEYKLAERDAQEALSIDPDHSKSKNRLKIAQNKLHK
ncbi:hypothetical protein AKO1_002090, partial [Acrasis kona]